MTEINKGTRIINYTVDLIIIVIISNIVGAILPSIYSSLIYYPVFFLYYFLLELFTGQTIGKKLTNTIVVNMTNSKPNNRLILLRSLLRLNPFDGISYLFGQEQGGHDLISKTRLVSKKDIRKYQ